MSCFAFQFTPLSFILLHFPSRNDKETFYSSQILPFFFSSHCQVKLQHMTSCRNMNVNNLTRLCIFTPFFVIRALIWMFRVYEKAEFNVHFYTVLCLESLH